MQIISGKRGSGKTAKLIEISSDKWFYIVCLSTDESHRILRKADEMGKRIPHPLTFQNFLNRNYSGFGIKGFLFDNIDIMIQGISDPGIYAMTLTDDAKND